MRAGARGATDPALASLLEGIASDEERHAALGWRTLAWLLRDADEAELRACRRVFHEAMDALSAAMPEALHRPDQGLLGGTAQVELRSDVLRRVVAPAMDALLRRSGPTE